MPEWIWSGVVGVLFVGVVAALGKGYVARIQALEQRWENSSSAVLAEKVRKLELEYQTMHLWKNSILPQQMEQGYDNIYKLLERIERDVIRRLDRIEKKQDGS